MGTFALMAMSDYLDGLLARKLGIKTRLGAILDPLADKALIISSVILLSIPEFCIPGAQVPNWVVIAIVGKDLWVIVGFVVVYLVTDRLRVQPTLAGKASTFGQLIMLASVLLAPDLDLLIDGLGRWAAFGAGVGVVVLSICATISYTRLGLRFVLSEAKPLDESATKTTGRTMNGPGDGTDT